MKILILQTAFIGDVVLTTPLIEAAKMEFPSAEILFLTIPYSAPVLRNHPYLKAVYSFHKRGQKGWVNTGEMISKLKRTGFDLALIPHRSLRSAMMVYFAGIPLRIGFDRSAGKFLLTDLVKYEHGWHEVKRNLRLLDMEEHLISPKIYPAEAENEKIDQFLKKRNLSHDFTCIAPGSIWETKRWPESYFAELIKLMRAKGYPPVFLVGSEAERGLCEKIAERSPDYAFIAAGELDPLESAALLGRSKVLIANDSAAGHIASAVGTRVVSIFGPTSPRFGFAPWGDGHQIVEHPDLYCRPCRIHGSKKCPEKHFRCMLDLTPSAVLESLGITLS